MPTGVANPQYGSWSAGSAGSAVVPVPAQGSTAVRMASKTWRCSRTGTPGPWAPARVEGCQAAQALTWPLRGPASARAPGRRRALQLEQLAERRVADLPGAILIHRGASLVGQRGCPVQRDVVAHGC